MENLNNINQEEHAEALNNPQRGRKRNKHAKESNFSKELIEWLDVLCVAIIAVVLVFSFVFRVATIDGNSMLNTLHHGDRVIITNLFYTPEYGDIVVISRNAENTAQGETDSDAPIIKRVIAVEGQTVDIDFKTAKVYIDGVELDEPYLGSPTYTSGDVKFPLTVPEGHIFVMGDNRCDSLDSRFSQIGNDGLVDTRYVLGHAVYRFFPFSNMGDLRYDG